MIQTHGSLFSGVGGFDLGGKYEWHQNLVELRG